MTKKTYQALKTIRFCATYNVEFVASEAQWTWSSGKCLFLLYDVSSVRLSSWLLMAMFIKMQLYMLWPQFICLYNIC